MSEDPDDSDKSHEASQKKLDDMRKEGQIARSQDLFGAAAQAGLLLAIVGPGLLSLLQVHSAEARGMALGMTAHAVGTSVALQEGEECGAFAALAMSLMGVATAVFLPLAVTLVV